MAIEKELKLANLQVIDITVTKVIQLFETKNSRSASHTSSVLIACCIQWRRKHIVTGLARPRARDYL